MNFDPKMMIGLLFQTQQQFTINNPISQHPIKNLFQINEKNEHIKNKIETLKSKENFETFANKCLDDLNKLNLSYGTAHYGYQYWVTVVISTILSNKDSIPNGCCTQEECSINQLYDIICSNLLD